MLNVETVTPPELVLSDPSPSSTTKTTTPTFSSAEARTPSDYVALVSADNNGASAAATASTAFPTDLPSTGARSDIIPNPVAGNVKPARNLAAAATAEKKPQLSAVNKGGEKSRIEGALSNREQHIPSAGTGGGNVAERTCESALSGNQDLVNDDRIARMGQYNNSLNILNDSTTTAIHNSINANPFSVVPNNPVLDFTSTVLSHDRTGTWPQKEMSKLWNNGGSLDPPIANTTPWEPRKVTYDLNYISAHVTLDGISSTTTPISSALQSDKTINAILVSHNGPESFTTEIKSDYGSIQSLGSPYVKITERDGRFDSWVVLPLNEFQDIYNSDIDLVRKHLFGTTATRDFSRTGVYPCEDCGYVYNREYNLRRHRKDVHAVVVKRVKCPYCGKYFNREDNLVRHVRIVHHKDEECICVHCGLNFNRHSSLKRHIIAKHKEPGKYKCDFCEARFAYSWENKNHYQNVHSSVPGYQCDQCGKRFKRDATLKEHIKFYHQGYRVICRISNCCQLFATMANFKKHKREHHHSSKRGPPCLEARENAVYEIVKAETVGEELLECGICKLSFHGTRALNKHQKQAHLFESCNLAKGPAKTNNTVPFKCPICASGFAYSSNYQSHMIKYHAELLNTPNSIITPEKPSGDDETRDHPPATSSHYESQDISVASELMVLQQNQESELGLPEVRSPPLQE